MPVRYSPRNPMMDNPRGVVHQAFRATLLLMAAIGGSIGFAIAPKDITKLAKNF